MTRPHSLMTCLAFAAAITAACSVEDRAADPVAPPLTELPPPVVGAVDSGERRAAADAEDWRLPDDADGALEWLRLAFVQDNRGEMEACGCPGAPTGGLARRASFGRMLQELHADSVLVEGPNALTRAVVGIEQIRGDQRARGRKVLELMAGWRPQAFFPGQADLAVVPLAELGRLAQFPVVISNLESPGAAGTLPSLSVQVGGRRVLLLGLVRPAVSEEARRSLPLQDGAEAAAQAIQEAGPVDLVVAFTDASLRDQTAWFAAGLDVDVLVTPPPPGREGDSEWRGRTLIVRSQPAGRSVQRLDVVFGTGAGRGLGPTGPGEGILRQVARQEEQYMHQRRLLQDLRAQEAGGEDPRVRVRSAGDEVVLDPRTDPERVQQGLAELKALRRRLVGQLTVPRPGHAASAIKMTVRADLPEDPTVAATLDAFGVRRLEEIEQSLAGASSKSSYLGHEACVDCHTSAQGHWARTPHARAWATLVARGEERNPECLTCHTTGFGAPGGFADPDKALHLLGVQCEACHGPMELHAIQARSPGFKPDPGRPVREATCRTCHDPINSPRFDYSTYAPRVDHPGRRRSP